MAAPKLKYASGNSASTTLAVAMSNTDTSASLTSDTNFSAKSGAGVVLIDEGTATEEVAYSTGKAGSALTIPLANRGLEGGSAQAHALNATVKGTLTAAMWNDLIDVMIDLFDQTTGAIDTTKIVTPTGTQTLTNKTLTSPKVNENVALTSTATELNLLHGVTALPTGDGWTSSADTWTYASASTFTISGVDRTAIYTPGTKLKFTQTSAKYAVVLSSAFSTNTTVTIAVNTDYVIANAAITAPFYSYDANPQGYPGWFAYSPTITGFTSAPATPNARFSIQGRTCFIKMRTGLATSNATGFTITSPATAKNGSGDVAGGMAQVTDNGTQQTGPGNVYILENTAVINIEKNTGGGAFTSSGNKGANFIFSYEI